MDGRDIGTVVFPDAELKLWITASIDIRAARRYKEYLEGGHEVSLEDVIENVKSRDFNDSNRKESPLIKAEDALNIVESKFSLSSVYINNTLSDGLDSDFSKGNVSNSQFSNIGGDALDFSGSNISIETTETNNINVNSKDIANIAE